MLLLFSINITFDEKTDDENIVLDVCLCVNNLTRKLVDLHQIFRLNLGHNSDFQHSPYTGKCPGNKFRPFYTV